MDAREQGDMRHIGRDLKYSLKGLSRSPVFTIVSLASIALGIGANTALFALVDEVLLRRLPVDHPAELVLFSGPRNHYGSNSGGNMLSFPMYEDFRDAFVDRGDVPALPRASLAFADTAAPPPIFSGVFCRRATAFNVGIAGETERVPGELVSGTYFQVLGVGPAIGRVITPEDDKVRGGSESMVAVLSYDYWRIRFAADPNVVGRRIAINNYPFTIIGVSQQGFDGVDIGYVPSVRVPVMMKAQVTPNWDDLDNRRSRWVNVFARMKPGLTVQQVKPTVQPFFHHLLEMELVDPTGRPSFQNASAYTREQFLKGQIDVLPASQGRSPIRQQLSQPLWFLMAVVAGVLLIACANVASLLMARAAARQKEFAVRMAIGAGRTRVVAQLLTESLLLSSAGGTLALIVASWTTRFLLAFLPASNSARVISGAIEGRVLAFNLAVSLGTGLLFGLAPALRLTRPNLAPTLKDSGAAVAGAPASVGFRKGLVVAQVTVSLLLLVGAGLFVRSLRNLRVVDLGINPEHVIALNVEPTLSGYTPVQTKVFNRQLAERIRAMPGVAGVAFAQIGLLEGNEWDSSMSVEGYDAKPGENMNPYCNAVSPGYFKTIGMALVNGREFDDRDARFEPADSSSGFGAGYRVAIVNASYARHYFGDRSPIGRHIGFGINPGTRTSIEIVGVVRDAKYTGVRDEVPRQVFFPFLQNDNANGSVIYVRTTASPAAAFRSIRQIVHELDSHAPVYNMRTLNDQIEASLVNERLVATLSTGFGVLATLLAIIGLYGVMAYTVARRTREIGVRIALGAVPRDVVRLVMSEALWLVAVGVVLGLMLALMLSRYAASQLYGIAPRDPLTIACATAALGTVALLAACVPARRATRISPTLALRDE